MIFAESYDLVTGKYNANTATLNITIFFAKINY